MLLLCYYVFVNFYQLIIINVIQQLLFYSRCTLTFLLRQYLAYRRFLTFFNFHSLRISIIYVSILAFCQVLLNEYDDDDGDKH